MSYKVRDACGEQRWERYNDMKDSLFIQQPFQDNSLEDWIVR